MEIANALCTVFVVLWCIEFYLFGMQRASLLISRTSDVDWRSAGTHLLPSWYPLTTVVRMAKWATLLAIAFASSWLVALIYMIAGLALAAIVPIPYHALYSKTFQRRVDEIEAVDEEAGAFLHQMLVKSRFA